MYMSHDLLDCQQGLSSPKFTVPDHPFGQCGLPGVLEMLDKRLKEILFLSLQFRGSNRKGKYSP